MPIFCFCHTTPHFYSLVSIPTADWTGCLLSYKNRKVYSSSPLSYCYNNTNMYVNMFYVSILIGKNQLDLTEELSRRSISLTQQRPFLLR